MTVLGEFYLVRAGNTRKGSGTFYTRPELAVPTVYRALEPLCYDKGENGIPTPKPPEAILGLKVSDPACGSASFLVASLDYLTDALYRSLCVHRRLDDPEVANRLTLPLGLPRTGRLDEDLVKFPPNDPYHGDNFEAWVKARLRRYIVERCIYGVDINPLAVELARVSLWIATLDPGLPFSFLDHKIKVGNSLVGCWLDGVEDYPLKAWEREGGDGKDGPRSRRIETLLKGEKVGNRRPGDGRIKREMRKLIETRFQGYRSFLADPDYRPLDVVARLRDEYQRLHDQPIQDPGVQEARYREIEASASRQRLKRAMDEWCAVWFWPTDEESIGHVPTPEAFHAEPSEARSSIICRLSSDLKFFHWELEFPEVFTPERSGFDALVGNPPWDVMKPNSQEFFSDFDPLYRTYDKQAALRKQRALFEVVSGVADQWDEYIARFKALGNWARNVAEPFGLAIAKGKDGSALAAVWAKRRQSRRGFADPEHPFRLQGSADLNSYKMFAEVFWNLLQPQGRIGVILPTGLYSDFGTKDLRETLLNRGRIELLYAFQNEKRVFAAAHHSYKQVAVFATKGGTTGSFRSRFRMGVGDSPEAHELPDDILRNDSAAMVFTHEDVRRNSPKSLSLVELRSQRDLDIFRKIYDHSIRIGDNAPGWEITYATEFHMTNDSKLFPPLEQWESKGYRPDVFGRWIGPEGDIAVPFYEGRMVGQFDFLTMSWVSGQGNAVVWTDLPFDNKLFRPKALIGEEDSWNGGNPHKKPKVLFRDIARNTDTRTMICSVVPEMACGHTISTLRLRGDDLGKLLFISVVMNSLCFDSVLRTRSAGTHQSWFIIEECPIADPVDQIHLPFQVSMNAARLTFLHRRFAPEWLKLAHLYPDTFGFDPLSLSTDHLSTSTRGWKHWWAVTEADRLRLRVEIDALCADLYGLDPDDFDWIVRDDPTDPKGFYRVDRQLPFRERLTGLAAVAFRTLKEGNWSAESAASLSNDEFFDLLGIPELTSAQTAHAKGLPGPLIAKRDGCHVWTPESFPEDDPRHGWTWDDCWNDAVALLGGEEAVRDYIEETAQASADPNRADRSSRRSSSAAQPRLFD